MADLALGWIACWLGVFEEVVGVKLIEAGSFPRLHQWIQNFKEAPIIKENTPDPKKLFSYFKLRRETIIASKES